MLHCSEYNIIDKFVDPFYLNYKVKSPRIIVTYTFMSSLRGSNSHLHIKACHIEWVTKIWVTSLRYDPGKRLIRGIFNGTISLSSRKMNERGIRSTSYRTRHCLIISPQSQSYQTLYFFVFQFSLLSLSVCYVWKKSINRKST